MTNWFPLGLATGKAFCNRIEERKHLKYNIEQGTHTLIISPKRYGKTSLAQKVMSELKLATYVLEFTLASDHITTQNIISNAIGHLLLSLMPSHKKVLSLASKYFSKLQPKLIFDTQFGTKIEFKPDFNSPQLGIGELLISADKAAEDAQKKVVLLMDEFQQIATLKENTTIEAAIRNAAQRMKNISIIFSGSNRHLLQSMFEDQSRPLYHLCERIPLNRINSQDYSHYIQNAALERWNRELDSEALTQILTLTQRHPYYVNMLCSKLWRHEQKPDLKVVEDTWQDYVEEEHFRIISELGQLSHHQKLMLMILAIHPFKQPTSKEIINQMRASVGSVAKTFKILLQQDYIYQEADGYYRILDPTIEFFLKKQVKIPLGLS